MSENSNTATNRRELLAMTLGGAALATLATTQANAGAKISQKSVAYQDSPKGESRCDNCKLFEAPNQCKNVEGPIAAAGWCRLWRKA